MNYFLYQNPHLEIINKACKLCYNGKEEPTLERKLLYIKNKIKHRHFSVLEHGMMCMIIPLYKNLTIDELNLLNNSHYIYNKFVSDEKYKYNYLFIYGNIRAFRDMLMYEKNSELKEKISYIIYENLPEEYFYDVLNKYLFTSKKENYYKEIEVIDYGKFEYVKDIKTHNIYEVNDDIRSFISIMEDKEDIPYDNNNILSIINEFYPVSIYFKDVSRIISQQITRHRNAISQLSQRYVDVRNISSIPEYIKEKYKDNEVISDRIKNSMNIYNDLRDIGDNKEDARYFLPQLINTQLYMTFTMETLNHFIDIRNTKEAQEEVRLLANTLQKVRDEIILRL